MITKIILILLVFLPALVWLPRKPIGHSDRETTRRASTDPTGLESQGFDPPEEQGDDAAEFTYLKAAQITAIMNLLNPN